MSHAPYAKMGAMRRTVILWGVLVALVVGGCDYFGFGDDNANGGLVGTSWTVEQIGGVAAADPAPTMT